MKVTVKTRDAVSVYNILRGVNLVKTDAQTRKAVLRACRQLRPVAEDFKAFSEDAVERLKPEGWDKVLASLKSKTATDEEKAAARRAVRRMEAEYQKSVDDCVREELEREETVKIPEPFTFEMIDGLIGASESLGADAVMLLEDVLMERSENDKEEKGGGE